MIFIKDVYISLDVFKVFFRKKWRDWQKWLDTVTIDILLID